MKRRKEANRDRKKIGVRTSVTVKVGDIDKKIREGESRSMRKELVVLYYLAHIASIIVITIGGYCLYYPWCKYGEIL